MDLLILLLIVLVLIWLDRLLIIRLIADNAPRSWWVCFWASLCAGLACGIKGGFFTQYSVSNTSIVSGFPIPVAVFRLEQGRWVDYVTDYPVLITILNVLLFLLGSLIPMWAVYSVYRIIRRLRPKGPNPEYNK